MQSMMIMKYRPMQWRFPALFLVLLLLTPLLQAQDLQAAKEAGWIGEQRTGYLGLVDASAPPAVQQLVQQINAERRRNYVAIAEKNRVELNKVELLAAEKALQKTPSGQFIEGADGRWVRK
jgi:uncharacterized protein YdbL (DUF1318 family)